MTGKLKRFPNFLLYLFSSYRNTERVQLSTVYYGPVWTCSL